MTTSKRITQPVSLALAAALMVANIAAPLSLAGRSGKAYAGTFAIPHDTAPPPILRASTGASAASGLVVGDRVKISFFELLDVPDPAPASGKDGGARDNLHTFYQRMDLTGEYAVQQDGSVTLPRLGTTAFAGRSIADVQEDLKAQYERQMGRAATVSITVTERLPVYVVGPIKNPGSYKHVPGMMVLHAVALAGGLLRGPENMGQEIDKVREQERMQRARFQLESLLARRARLVAQRDGKPALAVPEQLVALTGAERAAALVREETALFKLDRDAEEAEIKLRDATALSAANEVGTLRRRLAAFDEQIEFRRLRLADLRKLDARGNALRKDFVTMQSEVADIGGRRQEALVSVAQAEHKQVKAEKERDRFKLDVRLRLHNELGKIESDIMEAQTTLASASSIGAIMAVTTRSRETADPRHVQYEIVRRTGHGATRVIPAEETSDLEPGDILRISTRASSSQTPATYEQ